MTFSAVGPVTEILFPNHFKVIGMGLLGSSFYFSIKDNEGQFFGSVFEEMQNYTFKNPNQEVVCKSKRDGMGVNRWIRLYNSKDEYLGGIEHRVSWLFNQYEISGVNEEVSAVAQKNLLGTSLVLSNPSTKEIYATISRSFFSCCRDSWTVKILNPDAIDPRFIVVIPMLETNYENSSKRTGVISHLFERMRGGSKEKSS